MTMHVSQPLPGKCAWGGDGGGGGGVLQPIFREFRDADRLY